MQYLVAPGHYYGGSIIMRTYKHIAVSYQTTHSRWKYIYERRIKMHLMKQLLDLTFFVVFCWKNHFFLLILSKLFNVLGQDIIVAKHIKRRKWLEILYVLWYNLLMSQLHFLRWCKVRPSVKICIGQACAWLRHLLLPRLFATSTAR